MDNYWINRKERAEHAQKHTKEMEEKYDSAIKMCIESTKIYDAKSVFHITHGATDNIKVVDCDSVSAAFEYSSGKTAILNFASYKNPGGMFYEGSSAQEEALCHHSFLYNVLQAFTKNYYEINRTNLNHSLYRNKALYSSGVIFFNPNRQGTFDVITCAAPNKTSAQKYANVSDEENRKALLSRIRFVLNIAADNNVDTLILGAFGCGVFGQDPQETAQCFKEVLHEIAFKNVIFAIPKSAKNDNYAGFSKNLT